MQDSDKNKPMIKMQYHEMVLPLGKIYLDYKEQNLPALAAAKKGGGGGGEDNQQKDYLIMTCAVRCQANKNKLKLRK